MLWASGLPGWSARLWAGEWVLGVPGPRLVSGQLLFGAKDRSEEQEEQWIYLVPV